MNDLKNFFGKMIEIELSAKKTVVGKLIEVGSDLLVVFNGKQFFYIPLKHIVLIKNPDSNENDFDATEDNPFEKEDSEIAFSDIMANAKGLFVEMYVTGNQSIYGHITNVLDDYLVFYTPSYKTMYIPIDHIKWLIPHLNKTPYSVQQQAPTSPKVENTFKEQLNSLVGEVVLFDQGKEQNKIGLIKKIDQNIVEITVGNGQIHYLNIEHIKSAHGI